MRWNTLLASTVIAMAAIGGVRGGQEPPTFRGAANLVRLDVYPVGESNAPVTDLTEADFDVREDNVPQEIASVERVVIEPAAPHVERPEASTVAAAKALAVGERARILVVFLDTYHTDPRAARAVHQPLTRLLDQAMGPDDVVAVMTPEMSARDLSFSRRAASIVPALSRFEQFAMRDSLRRRDAEEDRYQSCFPERGGRRACVDPRTGREIVDSNAYDGVARELIGRRREQRVVTALTDLTRTLEGLNDGRKAVLILSGGWLLYRESPRLMRLGRCDAAPARPRTGTDGRESADTRTPDGVDSTICEADRRQLAQLDLHSEFRRMMDGANRANVSFYPIDVRGLAAVETVEMGPTGDDTTRGGNRAASLRTLAESTDGWPVVNTSDLAGGVGRMVSDLTSYYLIGYYSSNTRVDGTYRRVSVSVKRRGVSVRARRGYRAVSAGELDRQRTASALAGQTLAGPLGGVQAAVAGLEQIRPSLPSRSRVAYGPSANGRLHVWAIAELSTETVREGAWLGGGAVDAALTAPDNSALASAEAAIPAGQRSVVLDLGELEPPAVSTSLRLRLRPSGEGAAIAEDVPLAPLGGQGAGVPLLFRRGPTTGIRYMPTADPRFQRTERVRLELPRRAAPAAFTAALLDRTGAPLNVAVLTSTRQEGGVVWATIDLALAPLASGDYVVRVQIDGQESVTAIRVVP
jgi:VWFA-related protein